MFIITPSARIRCSIADDILLGQADDDGHQLRLCIKVGEDVKVICESSTKEAAVLVNACFDALTTQTFEWITQARGDKASLEVLESNTIDLRPILRGELPKPPTPEDLEAAQAATAEKRKEVTIAWLLSVADQGMSESMRYAIRQTVEALKRGRIEPQEAVDAARQFHADLAAVEPPGMFSSLQKNLAILLAKVP